jgi:peroxiredoxin/predicted 2-oxoglutarate/Fe(II)-dependent dioxygenase YbiX
MLEVGDFAPWFALPSTTNSLFHFNTVAGRRVILFFFGNAGYEDIQIILKAFQEHQAIFKQLEILLLGVSIQRKDESLQRCTQLAPNFIIFWDFEKKVSQEYGVCRLVQQGEKVVTEYWPKTLILNENLQVLKIISLENPRDHVPQVLAFLKTVPQREKLQPATTHPPVLIVPKVLDINVCRHLIHLYQIYGGTPSGFVRQVADKTVLVSDETVKKRRDFLIEDPQLQQQISRQIFRRVCPEIEKAFQFSMTRFERYLVACYNAQIGGYFRAHRDNTSQGTAHRRFAMTLNLNTGDYTGGYLIFPEYSSQGYQPQAGDAIIFSCSLMHEVTPVITGQRYALLSFFYGEQDVKLREENQKFIDLNTQSTQNH